MKPWNLLIAAVVVAGGGFAVWRFMPAKPPLPVAVTVAADPGPAPDVKTVDPVAVFQRAFWKRPSAADKILNAERREWQDEGSVSRWQWFLEVEPSPEIVRYLRDENAFLLTPAKTASLPANAPAWFIKDTAGARILTAPRGGMQLIFTAGDAKLYATDSGGGFRSGTPEKAPALAGDNGKGRLPSSPPPPRAKP